MNCSATKLPWLVAYHSCRVGNFIIKQTVNIQETYDKKKMNKMKFKQIMSKQLFNFLCLRTVDQGSLK